MIIMPHYQFKRANRLLKPAEFENVFKKPCKSSDNYFTVLAAINGLPEARLGLAITKKRVKKAVARNRLKRLIRESFRHNHVKFAGWDCVVMAKSSSVTVDNQILFQSLAKHWHFIAQRCKKSSFS